MTQNTVNTEDTGPRGAARLVGDYNHKVRVVEDPLYLAGKSEQLDSVAAFRKDIENDLALANQLEDPKQRINALNNIKKDLLKVKDIKPKTSFLMDVVSGATGLGVVGATLGLIGMLTPAGVVATAIALVAGPIGIAAVAAQDRPFRQAFKDLNVDIANQLDEINETIQTLKTAPQMAQTLTAKSPLPASGGLSNSFAIAGLDSRAQKTIAPQQTVAVEQQQKKAPRTTYTYTVT